MAFIFNATILARCCDKKEKTIFVFEPKKTTWL